MFERLHRSLGWGCKILGVDEPELYVEMNPVPNAFTYGHTDPSSCSPRAWSTCSTTRSASSSSPTSSATSRPGHVLYTVLARNIAAVVNLIGQATLGLGALLGQGLVIALYDWYRKAELTADRAGLLCVQDIDPCIRSFMKMAGGASRLYAEMDQAEFVRQIRAYEDADRSGLNRAYKLMLTAFRTHPFPILRAKELDLWHGTGYRDLAGPRGLLE